MPGRLIFHVIKIGRSARAGKATAMENGLNQPCRLLIPCGRKRKFPEKTHDFWQSKALALTSTPPSAAFMTYPYGLLNLLTFNYNYGFEYLGLGKFIRYQQNVSARLINN